MKEYISRKYNSFYNVLIIIVLNILILFTSVIIFTYLDEIIANNKYDVLIFCISFILILCVFIRINYQINEIVLDNNINQLTIKKVFSKKTFNLNEVQEINQFVLPYLNYIKINNKKFFFISRAIDPFGDNFTFNSEEDLENIRCTIDSIKNNIN